MEYKMSRRNLLGNYTQSTRVKDICILLVNDDYLCQTIVADMLDHCRYEVSHFPYEREMDAVNMIWERKDVTELVLTNVHRTYAKRHGIIEHIEKQIQLKVLLMPWGVDDINVSTLGGNGLTVYYMKCSVSEMDNLWANALAREKNKRESSSGKFLLQENAGSKRMLEDNDQLGNIEKKPRVNWTQEMHQKFLEAIAQLGDDKAFPKKIVELMNVPGLTRANVASHLQKYRMCMKRAQEGFTRSSSYDYTNKFGYNTLQESFQQSRWNPFQMGSRNTTIPHYNFDYLKSRSRPHHGLSLLKTIRYKPSHNFSVYGDQTKNILLRSVDDNRMHPNTSFAGFRLARDGKSVVFGQNSQLTPPVQQQFTFPEIRNDESTLFSPLLGDFTQQSSVTPLGIGCEPVSMTNQLPSLAELLAVDEPLPVTLTQPQPSAVPLEFEWNKVAPQQPPSPVGPTWSGLDEQLKFACEPQQAAVMTAQEAAGPEWTEWHEPHEFSPQQPLSGNTGNAGSDILSDFASTVLPEYCELGAIGDEIGVDATGLSDFDASLFDN